MDNVGTILESVTMGAPNGSLMRSSGINFVSPHNSSNANNGIDGIRLSEIMDKNKDELKVDIKDNLDIDNDTDVDKLPSYISLHDSYDTQVEAASLVGALSGNVSNNINNENRVSGMGLGLRRTSSMPGLDMSRTSVQL